MNVSKFHPLPSIGKIVLYKVNNFVVNLHIALISVLSNHAAFDKSIETMPITLWLSTLVSIVLLD